MSKNNINSLTPEIRIICAFPGSGKSTVKGRFIVDWDYGDFRKLMLSRHDVLMLKTKLSKSWLYIDRVTQLLIDTLEDNNNLYLINDPSVGKYIQQHSKLSVKNSMIYVVPKMGSKDTWCERIANRGPDHIAFATLMKQNWDSWVTGWVKEANALGCKIIYLDGDEYLSDYINVTLYE